MKLIKDAEIAEALGITRANLSRMKSNAPVKYWLLKIGVTVLKQRNLSLINNKKEKTITLINTKTNEKKQITAENLKEIYTQIFKPTGE